MTLEQIIARCQQTGELTEEQFKRLSDAAPVEGDGDEQQPEPPQEIEEF